MQCLLVFLLIYLSSPTCGSLQCTWSKGSYYKLVPYATHNLPISYSHGVPTEESCKELCLQQTSFLCAAYNYKYYNYYTHICELLAESDLTATKDYSYGWRYAVRPECAGLWMPWTAVKDVSITTSSADTSGVESVGELRTCMSYCMQTTFPSSHNKDCRSILTAATGYSCDLVNMRSDDTGAYVAITTGVVLFNRPVWYLDHSTGSMVEAVEGSGVSSNYSLVLLDTDSYRIPVDGHLVAWQYYIGTANNSCISFASIWRKISREYSRIAVTELTPENPERGGVRFQYVQNSTVVVQKNDFLGFYVDSNQRCGGNIISVSDGGNAYARVYEGKYEIPHPTNLSPRSGFRYHNVQVALKPYIAEFIMVEDAVITHNSSLSQGQIKLTWKEPTEQNNQYQPSTGYIKVECSTDRYFSTIVDCLPNVVPIENMEIVLEQLNITQPHYARLYVVRNYNGEELEQRRSSNDFYRVSNTQPFCAEREPLQEGDVNISEVGQLIPGSWRRVELHLPSLNGDDCGRYYLVSCGTKASESLWYCDVREGESILIIVTLELADRYRSVVWNQQHSTKSAPLPPTPSPTITRRNDSAILHWTHSDTSDYTVISYQITCDVIDDKYNPAATASLSKNTTNATTHSFIFFPLYPQVQYRCKIRTNIVNGYSNTAEYDTFWTKPTVLELRFSAERPKVFGDQVNITLPEILTLSVTGYVNMQLAVEMLSARHERDLTSKDIESSERYYITARIPILDIPEVFTVGDNETYDGYGNAPLAVGDYAFHIGFKAQTEEIVDFIAIPDSQVEIIVATLPPVVTDQITTGNNAAGLPVGGVVGVTISGVLVAILVIVLLVIVVRKRQSTKKESSRYALVSGAPLTDMGTSQIDSKSDAVTVEESAMPLLSPQQTDNEQNMYANIESEQVPSREIAVSKLHQVIQEMKKVDPKHPFEDEYSNIGTPKLNCLIGRKPENATKNRFKNIIAADSSRVVLSVTEGNALDTDYVNACYIQDNRGQRRYIASQGPIDTTIEDMWRLIHDTNSSTIVMLTNPIEACKKKCAVYYVDSTQTKDVSVIFGRFEIKLVEEQMFAEYIVRKLQYTYNQRSRSVRQFHFTQWPDHGVPTTPGLLNFRHQVKQDMASSQSPVIVHCSAGVGRTGTFIGLNLLIDEVNSQTDRAEAKVDVLRCVYGMRCQRTKMIQTQDQYTFLYEVLAEALACGDTSITCALFDETLTSWRAHKAGGRSVLEQQFENSKTTSTNITADSYMTALIKSNKCKNRDINVLPLEIHRVILSGSSPGQTDYVNAVFCNGYQMRNGFIVTQIPLADTEQDFWTMLMEKDSAVVVCLNDCQEEKPYWPVNVGEKHTAGDTTVQCLHKSEESKGYVFTELLCTKAQNQHDVLLVEAQMSGTELPTTDQLLNLCSKLERYATSGHDTITVQDRNGSRLSGIFVVAMNLFLRARIEQEVDIVLEVKLARRSRPQFIPDYESFDLLHEFLSAYLSQFSDYSNFR